ncbi:MULTISPECIES: AraC family transcriptional regulator [unclassified Modestobacter]|uniref:AraC family transcriptional regulator n=1 Tax=unclassified Modestobacter TaxID=2643866 RepID=UPI0022AAA33F|nr:MULTISPECIES: AraC family transcriptional regulator [unclassified Modestobacter]MCZ2825049.1 AraC family transcriptional regulator [Modestobacter sp. VKM Ac-2981]MCZ2854448.1 AraC family transcriptional regulator [Modestobacter sp. VKM Ac-2982]
MSEVVAWRPDVPGLTEVFHAHFTDHVYPAHTHESWTLLLVDDGVVRYDLDRHAHGASRAEVTLLPPGVPHDGRSWSPGGFHKRVLYLAADTLGADRVGVAVDQPAFDDDALRSRLSALHAAVRPGGDALEAQSRWAFVRERLGQHLDRAVAAPPAVRDDALADRVRDLLDTRVAEGLALEEAAALFGVSATHVVRAFTRRHGLPPHRYLTGRRIDLARRLLLDGMPAAEVAAASGFTDQSHLTRHFRRMIATTPVAYARSAG